MAATVVNPAGVDNRDRRSSRRRTKRIGLKVPIEVSGKDLHRCPFTVTTVATNLNRHGAMFHLNCDLPLDSVMVIKNSRGARASARVVAQTTTGDLYSYGVEFLEAENVKDFWGINFPALQGRH